MRLITAYFPHGGYNDKHVQQIYDTLTTIKHEAVQNKQHVIIGADCNAQAGKRSDDDNPHTIGQHLMTPHNARGQWLKNWASTHDLVLTNTFFDKPPHNIDTFTGPNQVPRQIDYILVTRGFWKTVRNCESNLSIDLGSDHKTVQLCSTITRPRKRQMNNAHKRQAPTKKTKTTWPPTDLTTYTNNLTTQLEDTLLSTQLDERWQQIEEAIKITISNLNDHTTQRSTHHNLQLTELIDQRRATGSTNTSERSRLSKQVRKEIRAIKRAERRAQIDSILEQHKNLERIAGIKTSKQKQLVVKMTKPDGRTEHDRQGIADVFADFYESL